MTTGLSYSTKETVSLLTSELQAQIKKMRLRYALWEAGCLLTNDDHGPLGQPYLMPKAPVQRARVYTGNRESGSYNHHSQLVKFKERYYLAFSNGFINEEAPGQRVAVSSSEDGLHWSPALTAVAGDVRKGVIKNTVGLYADKEEMILYCWSEVAVRNAKLPGMRRIEARSVHVDTFASRDGKVWKLRRKNIFGQREGQVLMFEAPRATREGLLLAGGTRKGPVAFLWEASEPAGKATIVKMPTPSSEGVFPYGEETWYQTDDGTIIMFWRDEGCSERLYVNTSPDGGRTWTRPVISDFPDSMARVYAGRLSDGRYYLVGNSYPKLLDRMHLMISISEDGYKFGKMFTLLDDPSAQRTKGLLKGHGYQYPCCLADKDKLLVAYSVNKEDIECGTVRISDL